MFALQLDEEKRSVVKEGSVNIEKLQKAGKGQGINNLIRGFGLDKDEYNYHLQQIKLYHNGDCESNH